MTLRLPSKQFDRLCRAAQRRRETLQDFVRRRLAVADEQPSDRDQDDRRS
jgi:hypothetical protein